MTLLSALALGAIICVMAMIAARALADMAYDALPYINGENALDFSYNEDEI